MDNKRFQLKTSSNHQIIKPTLTRLEISVNRSNNENPFNYNNALMNLQPNHQHPFETNQRHAGFQFKIHSRDPNQNPLRSKTQLKSIKNIEDLGLKRRRETEDVEEREPTRKKGKQVCE